MLQAVEGLRPGPEQEESPGQGQAGGRVQPQDGHQIDSGQCPPGYWTVDSVVSTRAGQCSVNQ